jgi:hypothetical protein
MKYHLLITLALFATGCTTLDYNTVEDERVRKTQPAETTAQQVLTRDVVMLKNGSILKGTLVNFSDSSGVKIKLADGSLLVYATSEVMRITKDTVSTPSMAVNPASEKNLLENWYTYWGLGYANLRSPDGLQSTLNSLSNASETSISIGIDILGFYWPLENQRTLLGGIINGAAERYELGGSYLQLNYYTYAFSAMHFLDNRIGDGFFVRADAGAARAVGDSNGGTFTSEVGVGGMLGLGYGFVISPETRVLLNFNIAARRLEGFNYYAIGFTIGGLF